MTTAEIASLVGGELVGDADLEIDSGHALTKATGSQIAFWEPSRSEESVPETGAGCVLIGRGCEVPDRTVIRVREPRKALARVLRTLHPRPAHTPGVDALASIDPTASIGADVCVGAFAVVGAGAEVGAGTALGPGVYIEAGAVVGSKCRIEAGAVVYGNARLGDRVVLRAGAVVGADGFGLVFETDHYENFPQLGGVEIGDDVEIGANSCIDRGALDATRVGRGTKLDNLVHIGHNCQIGRHVAMAAQVGLSGGVVVEDYAVLAGQVGVGDRATIGAKAQVGGQVGLLPDKKLAPGGAYWGTPARPLREVLKGQALVNRLPRLAAEVRKLAARVRKLERSS